MKAIKCDRCGKTYIPSECKFKAKAISGKEAEISPVYVLDIFANDVDGKTGIYDLKMAELCDGCYNSILYYVNNPNTVVVTKGEENGSFW